MSDEGKPPASVTTDLRVAHLTKAVTHKRQIRFELHLPENDSAAALSEDLQWGFHREMPYVPGPEGPISVNEVEGDRSKIVVVYKTHGKRNPAEDMHHIVAVFDEMEIPIPSRVREGIQRAFAAFSELNAQAPGGAVAAEAARRGANKGPGGGRGSAR